MLTMNYKRIFIFLFFIALKSQQCSGIYPQDVTKFMPNEKIITFSSKFHEKVVSEYTENESCRLSTGEDNTLVDWGLTLPNGTEGINCTDGDECMDYGVAKVVVTYEGDCEKVTWTSISLTELRDCVNILSSHWYGGGQQFTQPWPVETEPRQETAYVTSDMLQNRNWYGGVSERIWVSSLGIALKIDDDIPLFLSLPDNDDDEVADQICLSSRYEAPYVAPSGAALSLSYYLCYGNDVREVYEETFPLFYDLPADIPDERMITHPIWSTWAEYHAEINDSRVLDLAQNIIDYGFNNSQIEIDDNWETCYGDATFNPLRFADPAGMVDTLHSMGFRVTLWIHPFINDDCQSYGTADAAGYFIKDAQNQTQLTSWWQGTSSGLIDFTNPDAAAWWIQRLVDLKAQMGLDGYKFDAGETNWMPEIYTLGRPEEHWPNGYTTAYIDAISPLGSIIEDRVGFNGQRHRFFTRMLDKSSIFGRQNGLLTMVPSLLHSGILGYPFCLPDMVGGNAYVARPSSELFIRWAQSNTFMPSVQFSILPWNFDDDSDEVVSVSRDATALHTAFAPLIIELARNATQYVSPIARPTWWLCPLEEICLTADQQFLLGDDILVTPVVYAGAVSLDVVIPPGNWRRSDLGDILVGPAAYTLSNITLYSNIYFTRE